MSKKIVESGYNIIAADYNTRRISRKKIVNEFFDSLSNFFPAGGKLLDLGCGGGEPVTGYFARKGFDVIGVDISEEMIRIAREQIPSGTFIRADMTDVSFDIASFDLIVSTFAIIHLPQEEHYPLFRNIHRWLKPSGVAFLTLGAKEEKEIIREWKGVKMYWSHFGPDEYKEKFQEIGLQIIWEQMEDLPNGERFCNVIVKPTFHS